MPLLENQLENYIKQHSEKEDNEFRFFEKHTHLKTTMPWMMSDYLQGFFLQMVSQMIRPMNILEIGTFTGYTATCLAKGLKANGTLYTIENNIALQQILNETLGNNAQIKVLYGNALDILKTFTTKFDLVFIDADKANNHNYFEMVLPLVCTGGFILIDNVLWKGKVFENTKDKDTERIHNFNTLIANDSRIEKMILPWRDGITLCRKK
jgi:caffeoyl-CoA O-methyltransferase